MKFFTLICTLSTVLPAILAGPSPAISIETTKGAKTGRHIVMLKPGVGQADVLGEVASVRGVKPGAGVTHEWNSAVNGFAGMSDMIGMTLVWSNDSYAVRKLRQGDPGCTPIHARRSFYS